MNQYIALQPSPPSQRFVLEEKIFPFFSASKASGFKATFLTAYTLKYELVYVIIHSKQDAIGSSPECEVPPPPPPFQEAFNEFQVLEDRITYVATKVVHLGDQLESSNNRRQRAIETQNLMKMLNEFKEKSKPSLVVFNDPGRVGAFSLTVMA